MRTSGGRVIATINSKLLVDESSITNLTSDVNNLKSYDLQNTTNITNINNSLTNHTSDINTLKKNKIETYSFENMTRIR